MGICEIWLLFESCLAPTATEYQAMILYFGDKPRGFQISSQFPELFTAEKSPHGHYLSEWEHWIKILAFALMRRKYWGGIVMENVKVDTVKLMKGQFLLVGSMNKAGLWI